MMLFTQWIRGNATRDGHLHTTFHVNVEIATNRGELAARGQLLYKSCKIVITAWALKSNTG